MAKKAATSTQELVMTASTAILMTMILTRKRKMSVKTMISIWKHILNGESRTRTMRKTFQGPLATKVKAAKTSRKSLMIQMVTMHMTTRTTKNDTHQHNTLDFIKNIPKEKKEPLCIIPISRISLFQIFIFNNINLNSNVSAIFQFLIKLFLI